jgi:hypothetical protein
MRAASGSGRPSAIFGLPARPVYDGAMTIAHPRGLLGLGAILLVLAGCAGGASTSTPAGASPARPTAAAPLAAPVWQVGDWWVYEWTSGKESGTKTIQVIDVRDLSGVRYYVVRLGESEHFYTDALHWAAAVREGTVEARMVPAQPWFVWPLAPGARWIHQGRFEHREGVVTHDDRFAVIGPERVEVPAGRYEAIKLVRETNGRDSDEYWYAPDVRWYARWLGRRGDSQFEERLREYRPAPRPR